MRFNQLLIVDSIPVNEQNTARRLYEDVALRAGLVVDAPAILYTRVETSAAFLDLLEVLAEQAPTRTPVLHIECHGSDDGLSFADGSFLFWRDLKPGLTALNIATELNLLVVVAACDGRSIARTLTLQDRAPLHGLIGPTRAVWPHELETGFLAFYGTLLVTRAAADALAALRAVVPNTFAYLTAQWLFQHVWDYYQETYETPAARLARAHQNVANPPPGFEGVPVTAEQFAQLLYELDRPVFELFRRQFFLCDLHPGHVERFPVHYVRPNAVPFDIG